ncbi:carboxylate--amine ligase [Mycobacteriaceae bacterium 1482268.1]|nr:carboxylate--amine ligase [Mycobacteriaceae bacterium 1482268.1]
MSTGPTIGVEEEFFLVDPVTRAPAPAADRVIARARGRLGEAVSSEFTRFQIEVRTPPCSTAEALRNELADLRAGAVSAAGAEGLRLCASGTPVIAPDGPCPVGDHPRYVAGLRQYRAMLDDFAVCAMHVHVHVPDREIALLTGNHVRPWLPLLVAVSANSPFQLGRDTGYADWRAVIRSRFPCLGPPPYAESVRRYEGLTAKLVESEAMLEAATPFWDLRPNPRFPTLEVRAMSVAANIDDAVAIAVLIRALVTTMTQKVAAGDPGPRPPAELLRAAYWRAARDGWPGRGLDALTGQILPTSVQADQLVESVRPALEDHGDLDVVLTHFRRLAATGTGAERQRASAARYGTLAAVVDDLISDTARR